jgi:genome maintenance protein MGM101
METNNREITVVHEQTPLINPETGEVVTAAQSALPVSVGDPYAGAAIAPFDREIQDKLIARIPTEDLDVLPTGEVYASQVRYRRILNDAFGVGGWALKPRDALRMDNATKYMYRTWALFAHGRFISEAIGEQEYQEKNARMSYAAAAEGVKSNALTRCCKDLGVASECWDRRFTQTFKDEHCVKVFCKNSYTNKTIVQWRLKDSAPFWNETGIARERAPERNDDDQFEHRVVPEERTGEVAPPSGSPEPDQASAVKPSTKAGASPARPTQTDIILNTGKQKATDKATEAQWLALYNSGLRVHGGTKEPAEAWFRARFAELGVKGWKGLTAEMIKTLTVALMELDQNPQPVHDDEDIPF